MLVLAPVMCILSGIGVSQVLTTYMKNLDVSRPDKKTKKQQDSTYPIKNEVGMWWERLYQELLMQPFFGCCPFCVLSFKCSWTEPVLKLLFLVYPPGCQWDDSGHGFFPHHIHLSLYLGDQWSLLLSFNCPVGPWRWRQPHHLWWLQRGLLLAPAQHSRGLSSSQ